MKKIIFGAISILLLPSVLADYEHMMGYGMTNGIGLGIYGFIWIILAAFIFSTIFWSTYKWIIKEKKGKK